MITAAARTRCVYSPASKQSSDDVVCQFAAGANYDGGGGSAFQVDRVTCGSGR